MLSPRFAVPRSVLGRVSLLAGLAVGALAALAAPLAGDLAAEAPTARFGTLPTPYSGYLLRNEMLDPADLGRHDYQTHEGETKGLGYSCQAGFIDLDHVRDAADLTAHLYGLFLPALRAGDAELSFPGYDRADVVRVRFRRSLAPSERAGRAPAMAVELARRYAFLALTWHEVLTWFGYRTVFFASERASAFSYDDTVSNLIGTLVGARALVRSEPYNEALALELAQTMAGLGLQSRQTTLAALDRVKDQWWDSSMAWPSNAFVKKRLLELGLDGRPVRPWRVTGLPECEAAAGADAPAEPLTFEGLARTDEGGALDEGYIRPGMRDFWALAFPAGRPTWSGQSATEIEVRTELPEVMETIEREVRDELGEYAASPDPAGPRGLALGKNIEGSRQR